MSDGNLRSAQKLEKIAELILKIDATIRKNTPSVFWTILGKNETK